MTSIQPWCASRFERLKDLAPAIHGRVFLYLDLTTGTNMEDALSEAGAYLHIAKSPSPYTRNIVRVVGVFQDQDYTYLVSEYEEGRELFEVAAKRQGASEDEARSVIRDLLLAVDYLHSIGIAHRDISMENVLLLPNGSVKLLDFGQAVNTRSTVGNRILYKGKAGKPYYRAPEMYSTTPYLPEAVDAFACGVVLFIAAIGCPPWQSAEPTDSRFCVIRDYGVSQLLLKWNKLASPSLVDLLDGLLNVDPRRRMTVRRALSHPWFNGRTKCWTFSV